jgi:hypothetical protein
MTPAVALLNRPMRLQVTRLEKIRHLNYVARTAMGICSTVCQTEGFAGLSARERSAFREAIEKFDAFTPENDPHGENDFGAITLDGVKVFWKIDYYDKANPDYGSEHPEDASKTQRVLTIMLAEEY